MRARRASAGRLRAVGAATLVIGLAAWTGVSQAHPSHAPEEPLLGDSTLDHTVIGDDQTDVNDGRTGDDFELLRLGAGEPHVVREDLAQAQPGRADRRRSLVYLTQLTDFQLADEESPARVEFLDPAGGPVSSAWRPQEALVPNQVDYTIRQVNEFLRSPVTQGSGRRARMVNAVLTGDLADNQQENETEWVVRLLEGGTLDPGTGSTEDADYDAGQGCPPDGPVRDDLKDEAPRYTGVQDYDDYPAAGLVPDPADPTMPPRNRDFYDPDEPIGQYSNWPNYQGLMDRAQRPFEVEGLDVPSYVAFGNHDALVQGNQWANTAFDEVARGCVKVFPAPGAEDFLEDLLGAPLGTQSFRRDPELLEKALGIAEVSPRAAQQDRPTPEEPFQAFVPPDDERRFVDRPAFKELHDTGAQQDEHGFRFVDQDELDASNGAASYYDFSPRPRIRYIVLDTVSHGGQFPDSSSGNIDHPQFLWLQEKLRQAQRREELVLVFAHHAIGSLNSNVPDEAAPPCTEPPAPSPGPGCDLDPRISTAPGSNSPHQGSALEQLLYEFPNVLALIAGHSHENRIQPFEDGDGRGSEFWEIKSPAIVDWPPQHRLIEVMNNRDGTLSIFGTLLDDASQPRSPRPAGQAPAAAGPGDGAVETAQSHSCFETTADVGACTPQDLSSLGRTLSYNDPQVGPQGEPGARPQGVETDRNVELLLQDPRRDEPEPDPARDPGPRDDGDGPRDDAPRGGGGGGQGAGGGGAAQETVTLGAGAGVGGGGELPFTGLGLALLAIVGAALLSAGLVLRRRSQA